MPRHASLFHAEAAKLGIELAPDVSLPWLTRHGHLADAAQEGLPASALGALDKILDALDGDRDALASKTRGAMTADFLLQPADVHIEYDEVQHFTTARATTLRLYPRHVPLGFDVAAYFNVVDAWKVRGDQGFAHKRAVEFPGPSGRQRQRAYFDAFRDFAASHFGNGPLIRIAAPDNDYDAAARRLDAALDRKVDH